MEEKEKLQVMNRSFFGEGSGVFDSLLGEERECYVTEKDDYFGIMAHIMNALSQRQDIQVSFYNE